jgi:hypothetical protein
MECTIGPAAAHSIHSRAAAGEIGVREASGEEVCTADRFGSAVLTPSVLRIVGASPDSEPSAPCRFASRALRAAAAFVSPLRPLVRPRPDARMRSSTASAPGSASRTGLAEDGSRIRRSSVERARAARRSARGSVARRRPAAAPRWRIETCISGEAKRPTAGYVRVSTVKSGSTPDTSRKARSALAVRALLGRAPFCRRSFAVAKAPATWRTHSTSASPARQRRGCRASSAGSMGSAIAAQLAAAG